MDSMNSEPPLATSFDDTNSVSDDTMVKDHIPQPLRGPSLDAMGDLGVNVRGDSGGNAYSGIDFRDAESLASNLKLDNLKHHDFPLENNQEPESTNLKIVVSQSVSADKSVSSSPYDYPEDEGISAPAPNCNDYENPTDSLSAFNASSLTIMQTNPKNGMAPTLSEGKKYHVFFSYESSDRPWVEEVVRKLESPELGFQCSMHERDFHPGKRIIENITEHIRISEKTVLVLSPDFVQSHWCRFEIELGMVLCMEERQLLLVPVMVTQCDVPDSIKTLTYIDATPGNDWWHRFMDAITTQDCLLKTFTGAKDFTIQPRYGNMNQLTEQSSSFNVYSGEALRTPYIPDVLMRNGIQTSDEDFYQAYDIIRTGAHLFCNTMTSYILTIIALSSVFVVIYFNRGGFGNGENIVASTISFMCPGLASVLCFFVQRCAIKMRLQKAASEANKIFMKNNVIVGSSVKHLYWILFRIKLRFWYYNMSECQKQLASFLQTSGRFGAFDNSQDLPLVYAAMLIYRHSGEYASAYVDGKLTPRNGTRHVQNASCLCQFIEDRIKL